ncbi:uncharacterized protein LOC118749215 [Rhagoletis pomonella]|uniref:uncharacterized protein LOC118749215 n=1 Tax=Rhagoletis pomonella TaxID=28610 RepID=UPI001781E6AA|nr:uncharacterized protein LOC118749215 [Rhagoletis pomonella]XP_036339897.1 uncharacterized protein LOC118749215 [Rhagoletis pomonella]
MENGNSNGVPKPAPRSNNGGPTLTPRSSSSIPAPKPRASSGGPTPAPRIVQKPQTEAMVVDSVPDTQPDDEGADYQRCRLCARHHALRVCHVFRAMQPAQRYLIARAHHFCTNCLALSHHSSECPSAGVCKLCAQRHHTLLHRKNTSQAHPPPRSAPASAPRSTSARRSISAPSKSASYRLRRPPRNGVTSNAYQQPQKFRHPKKVRHTARIVRNIAPRGRATRSLVKEAIRKLRELESSLSA